MTPKVVRGYAGVPVPVAPAPRDRGFAESFDRLSALVDCYAPELRLGTCFTEGCRETDLDLPGCLACLLDLPGCEQQFGACEGDLARPVSP